MLSVEYFAAKDPCGLLMSVPRDCGLVDGDCLRVDGLRVEALRDGSVLPVDFPLLTEDVRAELVALSARGGRLPVGEFMALGLYDSYYLSLIII